MLIHLLADYARVFITTYKSLSGFALLYSIPYCLPTDYNNKNSSLLNHSDVVPVSVRRLWLSIQFEPLRTSST